VIAMQATLHGIAKHHGLVLDDHETDRGPGATLVTAAEVDRPKLLQLY